MGRIALLVALASVLVFPASRALAELKPDKIFTADAKKTKFYLRDGMVTGGDKAVNEVVVRDIRRGLNKAGYERIVIDLEATQGGQPSAVPRPPYYQVSVTPDEKRMVFSIWGNPRLGFDSKKVVQAFKKSKVVDNLELYPRLEENVWTFAMNMKSGRPVEIFELTNPVRIILDVRLK